MCRTRSRKARNPMKCRIRELREDNDLTQQEIAAYLHCDQSLYSKYERGERELPLDYCTQQGQYSQVSVDYLAGLTDRTETK